MPSELRRKADREKPSSGDRPVTLDEALIRDRAYHIYEERGRDQGHDLDDWLEAERELRHADNSRR